MTRPKGSKNKHTLKEEKAGLRTCSICEEPKPLTEFYPNGKYLMKACKPCDNAKRKARYVPREEKKKL